MMENIYSFFKDIVVSAVVGRLSAQGAINQLKTQHKYQDARNNLPIILEVLEDLNTLEQAFVFNGAFCPLIEHRCPEILLDKDGDGKNTMSPAQRAHQFRMIGYRIIRNCRKIIYLTSKGSMDKTLKICREIKDFLCTREGDSNTKLDSTINCLLYVLSGKIDNFTEFYTKLREFHNKLDNSVEEELPYLEETKKSNSNFG